MRCAEQIGCKVEGGRRDAALSPRSACSAEPLVPPAAGNSMTLGCFLLRSERNIDPVDSKLYQWLWISPADSCGCFHFCSLPASLENKSCHRRSSSCLMSVATRLLSCFSAGFAPWRRRRQRDVCAQGFVCPAAAGRTESGHGVRSERCRTCRKNTLIHAHNRRVVPSSSAARWTPLERTASWS